MTPGTRPAPTTRSCPHDRHDRPRPHAVAAGGCNGFVSSLLRMLPRRPPERGKVSFEFAMAVDDTRFMTAGQKLNPCSSRDLGLSLRSIDRRAQITKKPYRSDLEQHRDRPAAWPSTATGSGTRWPVHTRCFEARQGNRAVLDGSPMCARGKVPRASAVTRPTS